KVAIVTARNAPAHERVITTLKSWGVTLDEAFFLGGMEKRECLMYCSLTCFLMINAIICALLLPAIFPWCMCSLVFQTASKHKKNQPWMGSCTTFFGRWLTRHRALRLRLLGGVAPRQCLLLKHLSSLFQPPGLLRWPCLK